MILVAELRSILWCQLCFEEGAMEHKGYVFPDDLKYKKITFGRKWKATL